MPDTSSSTATDTSVGWAEVVALGRQLTQQLGDGAHDIALTWMAHHVARLMTEAENAEGAQLNEARERCRRAILDLWKARRAVFDRVPLQSVEQVASAVHALRSGEGWFFRHMSDGDDSPARAVQLAHAVDQGARAIIRTLIGEAVRQGLAEEKDWVWLIRSGVPDIEPVIVLLEEAVVSSPPSGDVAPRGKGLKKAARGSGGQEAAAASRLQAERNDLVERLRAFASVADEIVSHLETPIASGRSGRSGGGRKPAGYAPGAKPRNSRRG